MSWVQGKQQSPPTAQAHLSHEDQPATNKITIPCITSEEKRSFDHKKSIHSPKF